MSQHFTEHPHSQGMTYIQHALRAFSLSAKMGKGCLALLIHAIFPFLCQSTGTNVIHELYDDITPSSPPPSPSSPSSLPASLFYSHALISYLSQRTE